MTPLEFLQSGLIEKAIALVFAIVIMVRVTPALNRMELKTLASVRFALCLSLVGAGALVLWVVLGHTPAPVTLILSGALAALLICERRIRVLTGVRRK